MYLILFFQIMKKHLDTQTKPRDLFQKSSESTFPSYPDLQNSLPPTFKPEIYSLKKTSAKND